jgi:hypothetical protein
MAMISAECHEVSWVLLPPDVGVVFCELADVLVETVAVAIVPVFAVPPATTLEFPAEVVVEEVPAVSKYDAESG